MSLSVGGQKPQDLEQNSLENLGETIQYLRLTNAKQSTLKSSHEVPTVLLHIPQQFSFMYFSFLTHHPKFILK
jgi:hypothetical protein